MNVTEIIKEISSHLSPEATLWVAYSGGLDSSVLLHLVSQQFGCAKAIHVNHQLSPDAAKWQAHCEATAAQYDMPLISERVQVQNKGGGVEEAARQKRYAVFENVVKKKDVIVLGHHRDDIAETFLFRLARGAGLQGLSGIKKGRALGQATLLRPLLTCTKDELQGYAEQHHLQWIEDESNHEQTFDRNFIRHRVIPILQTRWPHLASRIANTSVWLAESQSLLNEYADADLQRCQLKKERYGESICLKEFSQFSWARQKHCVRRWCESNDFSLPDAAVIEKMRELINARKDASPLIAWSEYELRRYNERMYLIMKLPPCSEYNIAWSTTDEIFLPDGSLLRAIDIQHCTPLLVRNRRSGDRCKPEGRRFSQTLKKLMQEYKVEPWLRDRVPLVCLDDHIIAAADIFSCQHNDHIISWAKSLEWVYPG